MKIIDRETYRKKRQRQTDIEIKNEKEGELVPVALDPASSCFGSYS